MKNKFLITFGAAATIVSLLMLAGCGNTGASSSSKGSSSKGTSSASGSNSASPSTSTSIGSDWNSNTSTPNAPQG